MADASRWSVLEGMLADYSVAKVLDASDLVARLEGPAVESGTPASLASWIMVLMWKQVKAATTTTEALSNATESAFAGWAPRWPKSLSVDLTGIGEGSLFLGFRASRDSHQEVGFLDTGFDAMHSVLSGIAEAPGFFTETGVREEISERFPDHAIPRLPPFRRVQPRAYRAPRHRLRYLLCGRRAGAPGRAAHRRDPEDSSGPCSINRYRLMSAVSSAGRSARSISTPGGSC